MEEKKHCTQDHPFTIINILPVQHVTVFRQIADEFGVNIIELASAGQSYTERRLDQEGNEHIYERIVPEGSLKVRITSPTNNLNSFYDKATQVLSNMESPRIRLNHKEVSS